MHSEFQPVHSTTGEAAASFYDLNNNEIHSCNYTVIIDYTLCNKDILSFVLKVHGILLVLPLAFLMGYFALLFDDFSFATDRYICLALTIIILALIVYLYLTQFFIIKRQYSLHTPKGDFRMAFSDDRLTFSQAISRNSTEYAWNDFIKCRETEKKLYFYFRYDRALIVKKQTFIEGNIDILRNLISSTNIKQRLLKKH